MSAQISDETWAALQSTGCEHIQTALEGMTREDIEDLLEHGDLGGVGAVLSTIVSGTTFGYQAAASEGNVDCW